MKWRIVNLLLLCGISETFAEDCTFPIELPIIEDVILNRTSAPNEPVLMMTIKSDYPITDVGFNIFDKNLGWYRVTTNDDNFGWTSNIVSSTLTQLKLYRRNKVGESISSVMKIDFGCTSAFLQLGIELNNEFLRRKPFKTYKPGKIIEIPQADVIFEPEHWMDLRVEMQEYDTTEYGSLYYRPEILSFRNESGLQTGIDSYMRLREGDLPFQLETLSTPSSYRNRNAMLKQERRFKASRNLKNIIIMHTFYARTPPPLSWYYIQFPSAFHQNQRAEPLFAVKKCSDSELLPKRTKRGITLYQTAGKPSCFSIVVDGNPVPEFAVAEMSGNTIVQFLKPDFSRKLSKVNDQNTFQTPIVEDGKTRNYVLVVNSKLGFLTQNIQIKGYIPLSVEAVSSHRAITGPAEVQVECKFTGKINKVGIYSSQSWETDEADKWVTIEETAKPPGTFVKYNVYLNETVIQDMKGFVKVMFCAIRGENMKKIDTLEFNLSAIPAPTWY